MGLVMFWSWFAESHQGLYIEELDKPSVTSPTGFLQSDFEVFFSPRSPRQGRNEQR